MQRLLQTLKDKHGDTSTFLNLQNKTDTMQGMSKHRGPFNSALRSMAPSSGVQMQGMHFCPPKQWFLNFREPSIHWNNLWWRGLPNSIQRIFGL